MDAARLAPVARMLPPRGKSRPDWAAIDPGMPPMRRPMRTLRHDELKQMLDEGEHFHLINVLGRDAFREAHIPGSRNVPIADTDFPSKVEELVGGTDEKIVVYCASFDCTASPKAAKALEQAGFTRVWDYEGGIKDWKEAGYPVAQGGEAEHG